MNHRSTRLQELAVSSTPWTRTTAATDLDNWTSPIGDHSQFIRRVAPLNRPIVTLRTEKTAHTGQLTGLLGCKYMADVILDLVEGLINASPDHATLVLPLQTISLLTAGRLMTILPALWNTRCTLQYSETRGSTGPSMSATWSQGYYIFSATWETGLGGRYPHRQLCLVIGWQRTFLLARVGRYRDDLPQPMPTKEKTERREMAADWEPYMGLCISSNMGGSASQPSCRRNKFLFYAL